MVMLDRGVVGVGVGGGGGGISLRCQFEKKGFFKFETNVSCLIIILYINHWFD